MPAIFRTPKPFDPAPDQTGIYWTPPQRAKTDEVHPELLRAVAERPGFQRHTSVLFGTSSGGPIGFIDLAVDPKTREACATYLPCYEDRGEASAKAVWFAMPETVNEAVRRWVQQVQHRGWA